MRLQKRIIALFLCFLMIFTMLPTMEAMAAENYVTQVMITGLTKPRAGQTVAQNLASVKVPDNANYYIESIHWWSFDEGRILGNDDVFLLGDEYLCEMQVYTKNGYMYPGDNNSGTFSGEFNVSDLVIDSYGIEHNEAGEYDFHKLYLQTYNLIVGAEDSTSLISTASVSGLQIPEAGQTVADNLANVGTSVNDPYTIAASCWYRYEGSQQVQMNPTDTFQMNGTYYFVVDLKPKDGYIFTNNTSVLTADLLQEGNYIIIDANSPNNGYMHIYGHDFVVNANAKNGFIQDDEGAWLYYEHGAVRNYTGLAYDEQLGWWYVENGKINFDRNGLVYYGGAWWCVAGGQVAFGYTGLWSDPEVGWWYVENGTINFEYNGLIQNELGWWCVAGGRVAFEYTGLWSDPVVGWWYVENGAINFGYNGFVPNEFGWWCVAGGQVAFGYTGIWNDVNAGWWYVENGLINFAYTGSVDYLGNSYMVQNGWVIF